MQFFKERSFADMVCDGPIPGDGSIVTHSFPKPCLIESINVLCDVSAQSGARYGNIQAVVFREQPSEADLKLTGAMKNPLSWKPGYSYPYSFDYHNGRTFVDYLSQFDNAIEAKLKNDLGSNAYQLDADAKTLAGKAPIL